MIVTILQAVVLIAYVVALPLLARYLNERIKNIARESTEKALKDYDYQHQKALSDYGHQHQQALVALNATNQRRVHEYGLFAQRQHAVYARLYARYRKAMNGFSSMIGLTMEPNFKKYDRDDIKRYVTHYKLKESEVEDALEALTKGDRHEMGRRLSRLHNRVMYRNAERSFNSAKYFEALNELYLSDSVRDAVESARHKMAVVAVTLMRDDDERLEAMKQLEKKDDMELAVAKLLNAMRDEMRRGDEPAGAS